MKTANFIQEIHPDGVSVLPIEGIHIRAGAYLGILTTWIRVGVFTVDASHCYI
jgi:hypothetical protein